MRGELGEAVTVTVPSPLALHPLQLRGSFACPPLVRAAPPPCLGPHAPPPSGEGMRPPGRPQAWQGKVGLILQRPRSNVWSCRG